MVKKHVLLYISNPNLKENRTSLNANGPPRRKLSFKLSNENHQRLGISQLYTMDNLLYRTATPKGGELPHKDPH